ncbi:histidine kinase [Kitasatospora sp. NPDC089797]|uniref:sensor histidine kinase n=1 Tax=Kitasatospora sp. NPDC089797 TaxID=3155298 RepID=UPI003430FCED
MTMSQLLSLVVPVVLLVGWAIRARLGTTVVTGVAGAVSVVVTAGVWVAGRWSESDRWPGLVGLFELAGLLLLVVLTLRAEDGRACAAAVWTVGGAVSLWVSRFAVGSGPRSVLTLFGFGATFSLPAVLVGLYLRGLDEGRHRAVVEARRAQRLELAHDLHDFVAHDVSGMVAQAQAGAYLASVDPVRAAAVFDRIEQAGQRALASLDRTVQLLRAEEGSERSPQPGLTELTEVTERFTASGGPEVRLELPDQPVPREAAGTVHRIVVEALTNVRRHAQDAHRIEVRVGCAGEWLELTVTNDGLVPGSAVRPRRGGGSGLLGLAARVEGLGGIFEARAHDQGVWRVTARLPLAGREGPERSEASMRNGTGARERSG